MGFWTYWHMIHYHIPLVSYWRVSIRVSFKAEALWTHDLTVLIQNKTPIFKTLRLLLALFCFFSVSAKNCINQHYATVKCTQCFRPSLRWTVRPIDKNHYELCHLFYICSCKIKVWDIRMFIPIYCSFVQPRPSTMIRRLNY
jgi:hypothetical protein